MKLAVIHLTDLHIQSPHDSILTRASTLAAAIYPRIPDADHILLAITGDISYSGQEDQLIAGFEFLLDLHQRSRPTPRHSHIGSCCAWEFRL